MFLFVSNADGMEMFLVLNKTKPLFLSFKKKIHIY